MNQITNSACYLLDLLNSFFQLGVIFEDNSYNHRAFIMLFTFSKDNVEPKCSFSRSKVICKSDSLIIQYQKVLPLRKL